MTLSPSLISNYNKMVIMLTIDVEIIYLEILECGSYLLKYLGVCLHTWQVLVFIVHVLGNYL
jgi:hypothetical protein